MKSTKKGVALGFAGLAILFIASVYGISYAPQPKLMPGKSYVNTTRQKALRKVQEARKRLEAAQIRCKNANWANKAGACMAADHAKAALGLAEAQLRSLPVY